MFTRGEYQDKNDTYGVLVSHTKQEVEVILVSAGQVCSAFKATHDGTEYSFLNKKAKDLWKIIHGGISGCKSKNGSAVPFELGTSVMHEFTKSKNEYCIELYNGCLVGCDILTALDHMVKLSYVKDGTNFPQNIPYIKLTTQKQVSLENDFNANDVVVRSVEEIALEKNDITWLKKKKYYIVNDDEQAEKIFSFLDKYNGAIAYDTETTGLKINCFGKINSKYKKQLEEYNLAHPDEPLRADRLVGIIFCVEDNVSYYFPCFNRKFKNLYDTDTPTRQQVINNIKARYTIGDLATVSDEDSDMAQFIRNNPPEEWGSDVILMERVRDILQTKHIVAHNGSFEWKVGWQYEVDTNLKDDTMIMHQIMYKFRSTTSNRGEPSNLKFLSKLELGIDQWELGDFFPDFKEDTSGTVRSNSRARGTSKKQNSKIDFSYMTYEGTRVYAPTDGDATFLLYKKYKTDMLQNHREQEYIYNVEVIVACAIAYMEFYGIRINEDKITAVRDQTKAQIQCLISEIRQSVDYAGSNELEAYNNLKLRMDEFKKADNSGNEQERTEANLRTLEATDNLVKAINDDAEHQLNLASPAQVAELFYDVIGIPLQGEKRSVAKREIKGMLKMKNDDGSLKYPVVKMYSDYKKLDTLMTKFFDNLPYYMYPGGLIFCSFGQISTATGRMSCSKPNAQQFPKDITKIIEPRPGYVMLDADYSQIEYRVLTGMAGNEGLAKLFSDPDSDYHTLMASMMYNVPYASVTPKMRSDAKSFNFGIPYGMGLKSLAILLTGMSGPAQVDEAKEKYEKYFQNQPKTRKFFDTVKEQAQINGYTRTFWNRYRYYTFMDADGTVNNARKAAALRQAGNAVIQGCISGDTRIQTKEYGIVKIQDVAGERLTVWDGEHWVLGDITYSGKKKKCIVTFGNNQKFICSPIHKFLTRTSKGNEMFVRCEDLKSSSVSTNPHRVLINKEYSPSDYVYTSEHAIDDMGFSHNANNHTLADIGDSFKIGVVLGRLASDGSIFNRDIGGSSIRQIVAEHESDVADTLMNYMKCLGAKRKDNDVREGRNESLTYIDTYGQCLVNEISRLDIKHQIHKNIFKDTELLRGFLRGMFDGDGGISGKTISLVFGTQFEFEEMCRDIQKALTMLGIRSRYSKYEYRHKITISTYDNEKFMDLIGFISKYKNVKGRELTTVKENRMFSGCLVVKSVEITDEYIDMYDVCNTDGGYYVADGIITHNTAADIFKISVARNFMYIRKNKLLGHLLIINMIHDEQLMEINAQKLNVQRILRDVGHNMQFNVEGFPPLYIGAGIGKAWGLAKGKMAEIHPNLLNELSTEADNIPIFHGKTEPVDTAEVLKYFDERVLDFRRRKVADYLLNPENYGKDLHPAIGNLLNLQFTYGHDKDAEGLKDDEFTLLCVKEFINHNNLEGVKAEYFKAQEENTEEPEEEDEDYDDDEDGVEEIEGDIETQYNLIDESDVVYGTSIHDIIKTFKYVELPSKKILGLDVTDLYYKNREDMIDYLSAHVCEEDDEGAMEVTLLSNANVINRTGLYVNNIEENKLRACLGMK